MKKKLFLILTVMTLVLTIPAYAIQARSPAVFPSISFSGTTATCTVTVEGDYATDEIEVDVELWEGSTLKKSWSDEGTEYVDSIRKVSVTSGKTYTLKAYATVNGRNLPEAYITRECP